MYQSGKNLLQKCLCGINVLTYVSNRFTCAIVCTIPQYILAAMGYVRGSMVWGAWLLVVWGMWLNGKGYVAQGYGIRGAVAWSTYMLSGMGWGTLLCGIGYVAQGYGICGRVCIM